MDQDIVQALAQLRNEMAHLRNAIYSLSIPDGPVKMRAIADAVNAMPANRGLIQVQFAAMQTQVTATQTQVTSQAASITALTLSLDSLITWAENVHDHPYSP